MSLVAQAERLCAHRLEHVASTQYIAAFRTVGGYELALERNRKAIFCWAQPRRSASAPFTRKRVYLALDPRNSNLTSHCPTLRVGVPAHYWRFDGLDAFESFLKWYEAACKP